MQRKEQIDAIILAGGKGTRLMSVVSDVPKPLAPVNGRPFLDYQLELLAASGQVRRVVLSTGHLSDKIEAHYATHTPPLPVSIAREPELLGTGGGLVNALGATKSDRVLALNGDSMFHWTLPPLWSALDDVGVDGGAALALVHVDDLSRYGGVDVENGRVLAFREKQPVARPGLINAGVYLFDRALLAALPTGQVISLERDVFPKLAAERRLAAAVYKSDFIDIGLPETYAVAANVLSAIATRSSFQQ